MVPRQSRETRRPLFAPRGTEGSMRAILSAQGLERVPARVGLFELGRQLGQARVHARLLGPIALVEGGIRETGVQRRLLAFQRLDPLGRRLELAGLLVAELRRPG